MLQQTGKKNDKKKWEHEEEWEGNEGEKKTGEPADGIQRRQPEGPFCGSAEKSPEMDCILSYWAYWNLSLNSGSVWDKVALPPTKHIKHMQHSHTPVKPHLCCIAVALIQV